MKKFLMSLSIIAICAMAFDISMLNVQNLRLKSKVADANLAFDLAKATVEQANKATSDARKTVIDTLSTVQRAGERIDQLQAELKHCSVVAVRENQGAHTFVYVEADSWVDLSNGEKVPAMRKIASPVDIDPNPKARWQSGPVTSIPLTSLTPGPNFNHLIPQSPSSEYIGDSHLGTGGWNR